MYVPSAQDIAWARELIRTTKDGAIWIWPNSGLQFKLDHTKKRVICLNPTGDPATVQQLGQVDAVFKPLGYLLGYDMNPADVLNLALPLTDPRFDLANNDFEETLAEWLEAKAILLKTWNMLEQKRPWDRALFPFYLDISAAKHRMWHGKVGTSPKCLEFGTMQVSLDGGTDKDGHYRSIVVDVGPFRAFMGYHADAFDGDPLGIPAVYVMELDAAGENILGMSDSARGEAEKDSYALGAPTSFALPLRCAMLAIIDLLTVEVRKVEARRPVNKKINLGKRLPTVKLTYKPPVVYAPQTKVIYDKPAETPPQPRPMAESVGPRKPRRQHRVAAFKRNVRMTMAQYTKLMALIDQGIVPVDREGNPIPMPKDREYTIVLEQVRGGEQPEVVSKAVLDYTHGID